MYLVFQELGFVVRVTSVDPDLVCVLKARTFNAFGECGCESRRRARNLETSGSSTEKPLLPPGRPFIASARTLTGTVWSTFGQESSTLVRNKFIVVE